MKIRSFSRYLVEALRSIARNKMMSFTSVIIVSACLLIMTLMYVVTANLSSMLDEVMTDVRIAIFVEDFVPEGQPLLDMRQTLLDHPHITSIIFFTREENLENMIESLGWEEDLLGGLDRTTLLNRRFDLFVNDVENVHEVVSWLENAPIIAPLVYSISSDEEIIGTLIGINRTITIVSASIIGVLAILSVIIIMNTIRLTIDSRKVQIGIMKFIGATNGFIRGPFIFEGMLLGLVGAAIPLLVVITMYDGLMNSLIYGNIPDVQGLAFLTGGDLFPILIPAVLGIGAFLGVFSSVVTIRKYLNV